MIPFKSQKIYPEKIQISFVGERGEKSILNVTTINTLFAKYRFIFFTFLTATKVNEVMHFVNI